MFASYDQNCQFYCCCTSSCAINASPLPGNISTAKLDHRLAAVPLPLNGSEISGSLVFVVNKA